MKNLSIGFFFLVSTLVSCQSSKPSVEETTTKNLPHYIEEISKQNLLHHLTVLSSDEMEGRKTGEEGQKKAAHYIRTFYKSEKIAPAQNTEDYYQTVPSEFMASAFGPALKSSENVIAYIEGTEFPDEYVVLSAHFDHMGIENGEIYNGADDNASGTAAVLEMARVFQLAKNEGNGPKRSILLMNFTGEEFGLYGSEFYVQNPLYPLENTTAGLNIDMIGRIDPNHESNSNYIYLVGSDRLSKELFTLSENTNNQYIKMSLDYKYDSPNDPEMIYYRSDHYNFAKNNIPVIFYFDGIHEDYHKPTDTVEKINFDLMRKRTQLIFATAWEIANRKDRLKLDNE